MSRDVVFELHVQGDGGSVVRGIPASDRAVTPGVSVVVCTYRRPDSLALLLQSLRRQDSRLRELLIVDASPAGEARPSQDQVREWNGLADAVHYWQVTGQTRGLTRQRNFALQHVSCDLVLFLDDDVILQPTCVREMEEAHRSGGLAIAGVGCYSSGQFAPPPPLWRIRRALGIVPSLQPGRYWRSGVSIPWSFAAPTDSLVDGDWLPGCAMMWKYHVVKTIGFDQTMEGYAQGEDLDFSLRARRMGRLVMLGRPRLEHRHHHAGRPNAFQLGYMELRNRFEIHRRALTDRTPGDVAWFTYAWTVDTILLARHLVVGGRRRAAMQQIAGRVAAAARLCLDACRTARVRHAR
jgi:GT2 family glycosyltransferase